MKTKTRHKKFIKTKKRNWVKFLLLFFVFGIVFAIFFSPIFSVDQLKNIAYAAQDAAGTVPSATAPNQEGGLINQAANAAAGVVANSIGDKIVYGINVILQGVYKMFATLLTASGVLFDYAVQPGIMRAILNSNAVYNGWATVRDFLNLFFIMVLLYSAFCTIFQVDQFNLKKILLTLVIIALLVNFSFPISRFIIDTSNVPMYFFLNNLFEQPDKTNSGPFSISANIMNFSQVTKVLIPSGDKNGKTPEQLSQASVTAELVTNIIFVFIFAVTMFFAGFLLFVRVIALAILVIFAPVGFMASIFPSTKSWASQWWNTLFKQATFGPVMIFMIYLAYSLMEEMQKNGEISGKMQQLVQQNGITESYIAYLAYLMLPIIILWMGLLSSQKLSATGSSWAVGRAERFSKWFGGKTWMMSGGAAWGGTKFIGKTTGIPGGAQQAWASWKKRGILGSDARERREAWWAQKGRKKGAYDEHLRKKASEIREEWKKVGGATSEVLEKALKSSDKAKAMAAAMEMVEKNGFGDPSKGPKEAAQAAENYRRAFEAVASNPVAKAMFDDKVKERHLKFKIDYEIMTEKPSTPIDVEAIYQRNLGKLTAEQLAKQKNLHNDADFHNSWLNSKFAADPRFARETARRLSQSDRDAWRTNGQPI